MRVIGIYDHLATAMVKAPLSIRAETQIVSLERAWFSVLRSWQAQLGKGTLLYWVAGGVFGGAMLR